MKCAVILVAVFGLAAVATASFPYAKCTSEVTKSVYQTYGPELSDGGKTFCFTIVADDEQCTTPDFCCTASVKKLEIDANPECETGFKAVSTITFTNGTVKTLYPDVRKPPNAKPNEKNLVISAFPALNPTAANGTRVCTTITKGSCPTFQTLARNYPTWNTALWDLDHKCCPITTGTEETCKSTISWQTEVQSNVAGAFSFQNTASQNTAKTGIPRIIKAFTDKYPTCLLKPAAADIANSIKFVEDTTGVTAYTAARIDLEFKNNACGKNFEDWMNGYQGNPATVLDPVFGDTASCRNLKGQTPTVEGFGACSKPLVKGNACSLPSPPPPSPNPPAPIVTYDFPKCICANRTGDSAFYIADYSSTDTSLTLTIRGDGTVNSDVRPAYCKGADVLDKVEFFFKDTGANRRNVLGATVTFRQVGDVEDTTKFFAPSWGSPKDYPDTYKVARLGLSVSDLAERDLTIVINLNTRVTWADVSAVPGKIVTSLFDPKVKCCPTEAIDLVLP